MTKANHSVPSDDVGMFRRLRNLVIGEDGSANRKWLLVQDDKGFLMNLLNLWLSQTRLRARYHSCWCCWERHPSNVVCHPRFSHHLWMTKIRTVGRQVRVRTKRSPWSSSFQAILPQVHRLPYPAVIVDEPARIKCYSINITSFGRKNLN